MYGHIKKLAEAEKKGIESAGCRADIFQSSGIGRMELVPGREGVLYNFMFTEKGNHVRGVLRGLGGGVWYSFISRPQGLFTHRALFFYGFR